MRSGSPPHSPSQENDRFRIKCDRDIALSATDDESRPLRGNPKPFHLEVDRSAITKRKLLDDNPTVAIDRSCPRLRIPVNGDPARFTANDSKNHIAGSRTELAGDGKQLSLQARETTENYPGASFGSAPHALLLFEATAL
ncbi:MAG: hypothetical protein IID31_04740 [Planctomycetes bacterium]|nr:hypothetical protein [Planctomycetota bacterium]